MCFTNSKGKTHVNSNVSFGTQFGSQVGRTMTWSSKYVDDKRQSQRILGRFCKNTQSEIFHSRPNDKATKDESAAVYLSWKCHDLE